MILHCASIYMKGKEKKKKKTKITKLCKYSAMFSLTQSHPAMWWEAFWHFNLDGVLQVLFFTASLNVIIMKCNILWKGCSNIKPVSLLPQCMQTPLFHRDFEELESQSVLLFLLLPQKKVFRDKCSKTTEKWPQENQKNSSIRINTSFLTDNCLFFHRNFQSSQDCSLSHFNSLLQKNSEV